jgi:multidrug efflux pump subunit AcrA (membrane-fusion protein)
MADFSERATYFAPIAPLTLQPVISPIAGIIVSYQSLAGNIVKKNQLLAYIRPAGIDQDRSLMKLFAPMSGIMMDTPLRKGSFIQVNTRVTSIFKPDSYQATLQLASSDTQFIKIGDKVDVLINQLKTQAVVDSIAPSVNPRLGTQQALLTINKTDGLKPGHLATFTFKYKKRKNFKLPISAIKTEGTKHYINIVKADSTLERLYVETGKTIESTQEVIAEGLTTELKIVSKSSKKRLKNGEKVAAAEAQKTDQPQLKTSKKQTNKHQH